MQDADYKWFEENCKALYEQYGDSYIAIKDQMVLGSYSSYADAVRCTSQEHKLGSFIIQRCADSVEANTVYIASAHFMPEEVLV